VNPRLQLGQLNEDRLTSTAGPSRSGADQPAATSTLIAYCATGRAVELGAIAYRTPLTIPRVWCGQILGGTARSSRALRCQCSGLLVAQGGARRPSARSRKGAVRPLQAGASVELRRRKARPAPTLVMVAPVSRGKRGVGDRECWQGAFDQSKLGMYFLFDEMAAATARSRKFVSGGARLA
jgi:hypothetical protein